jgi:hypothetical protein
VYAEPEKILNSKSGGVSLIKNVPDWCIMPTLFPFLLITNRYGESYYLTHMDEMMTIGSMYVWRASKGIYRFAPEIYEALISQPLTGNLPTDCLYHLPEWAVYIETPGLSYERHPMKGFIAHLDYNLFSRKSDGKTLAKIKAAIEAAYKEGEAKLKGNGKSVPALSAIKTPLRDGDTERPDDPAYANAYFINANASSAPGIVDVDRNPILTRSEVYSGVYGRASITFYAFNSSGNRGIACGLNNLQKVRDGEPLGGKASAEDDFSTDEDDDFLD